MDEDRRLREAGGVVVETCDTPGDRAGLEDSIHVVPDHVRNSAAEATGHNSTQLLYSI